MPVVRVGGGRVGVGNGESELTCGKVWQLRSPGVGLEVTLAGLSSQGSPVFYGTWKPIQTGPTHWAE